MKTSYCKCGNRLFFNNHSCVACGRLVGDCCACSRLTSFSRLPFSEEMRLTSRPVVDPQAVNADGADTHDPPTVWQCDQPGCQRQVVPCSNRLQDVCTSFVTSDTPELCHWCQFTRCIPDLSVPANRLRWAALESAKRRLLSSLERLELPPYIPGLDEFYPLSFEFRLPVYVDGELQPVSTGHAEGIITINAEEADSDRREATRIALGEPQRTLIGHMRHEIGHYIDWSYASRIALDGYVTLFGNPDDFDYEQAKQRHYTQGPPGDWREQFVSAYASMHPWEDFAETVNAYLDIMAIAETARDQKLAEIDTTPTASTEQIVAEVLPLAIAISEFNLDLGLQLLLPEHLSSKVIDKLSYVHRLRHPALREDYINQLEQPAAPDAPASR